LAQILGGLFAGGLIFLQLPDYLTENAKQSGSGLPIADSRYSSNAFVVEMIGSAFLAFIVVG